MLVLSIAEDFNKLLQDGILATMTALCKAGRVMVVAVDIPIVLVVAVLSAEYGRTHRAGEVLNVVFAVEGGDVGAAQGTAASEAEEIEAAEVIRLAERILVGSFIGNREEL